MTTACGNPGFARKKEKGDTPLPPDITTVPKLFRQIGCTTGIIGKWGMGNLGTSGHPLRQNFSHFFCYMTHTDAHDYYPDHLGVIRSRFLSMASSIRTTSLKHTP